MEEVPEKLRIIRPGLSTRKFGISMAGLYRGVSEQGGVPGSDIEGPQKWVKYLDFCEVFTPAGDVLESAQLVHFKSPIKATYLAQADIKAHEVTFEPGENVGT